MGNPRVAMRAEIQAKLAAKYEKKLREMVEVQMDRKVMKLDDMLRGEALASRSKNQPGDCHGASPLAMTRKGETA